MRRLSADSPRQAVSLRTGAGLALVAVTFLSGSPLIAAEPRLDSLSSEWLTIPALSDDPAAAGKRVKITTPQYAGTSVFHTVYLPCDWKRGGQQLPIIFEYTGNFHPQSGSTGQPKDAALGFGLSGGRYIWITLPYINSTGNDNAPIWWGDERATIDYAKQNVPRIIDLYGADRSAVFLCGFSRGAIAVNYIGLHDEEIANLWTAFIAHDHFDGVRAWKTAWGSPLDRYQSEARKRLSRVGNKPYWVSQNGSLDATQQFVKSIFPDAKQFTFSSINMEEVLGSFPNEIAKSSHTDRWLLKPSRQRSEIWDWMNRVAGSQNNQALPPSN